MIYVGILILATFPLVKKSQYLTNSVRTSANWVPRLKSQLNKLLLLLSSQQLLKFQHLLFQQWNCIMQVTNNNNPKDQVYSKKCSKKMRMMMQWWITKASFKISINNTTKIAPYIQIMSTTKNSKMKMTKLQQKKTY